MNKDIYTIPAQVVQDYPYVALDTEFPGVVARPIGEFKSTADYQYQLLRWVITHCYMLMHIFSSFTDVTWIF